MSGFSHPLKIYRCAQTKPHIDLQLMTKIRWRVRKCLPYKVIHIWILDYIQLEGFKSFDFDWFSLSLIFSAESLLERFFLRVDNFVLAVDWIHASLLNVYQYYRRLGILLWLTATSEGSSASFMACRNWPLGKKIRTTTKNGFDLYKQWIKPAISIACICVIVKHNFPIHILQEIPLFYVSRGSQKTTLLA